MERDLLIFDASAIIFSKSIWKYIHQEFTIIVSPLIKNESGVSDGLEVVDLNDKDKEFVARTLHSEFSKHSATNYKKGKAPKNAGEIEALALAKRFHKPIVYHDNIVRRLAKARNIQSISLVDLPDRIDNIPKEDLIDFYKKLCRMRSSEKACQKITELMNERTNS